MTQSETLLTILVIEDDRIDYEEIQRLLARSGLPLAEVSWAEDLDSARARLEVGPVDVALVDLNLPDSSGFDTVQSLSVAYPDLPLVVITGRDAPNTDVTAVGHGAQDYLVKGELHTESLAKALSYARERKRTERALRRGRDFAEQVIETTQAIVLVLDLDLRIVRFNSYMAALTGYSVPELEGDAWMETLIPQADRAALHDVLRTALHRACGRGLVTTLTPKGGGERLVEWTTSALHDDNDGVIGVLATGQDITERKRAQETARTQATFLETLLQAMPCPVYYQDRKGRYLGVNRAFERLSGRSAHALVGLTDRDVWPESFWRRAEECHADLLRGGGRRQYEARVRSADGDAHDVLIFRSVFRDAEGQPAGTVGALLDITARKQAEQETRQANEDLERANRELKEMHTQVVQSEKLASIGQLAAGVAHEMNTPVGFVGSNFETLRKYVGKLTGLLNEWIALLHDLPEDERTVSIRQRLKADKIDFIMGDIKDLFEESAEGIERVTSIVQNLRDFSRVDDAEARDAFDLNKGLRATLVVARNAIKYDADVELALNELPPVTCIPGQINQVFLNILVNAAQAIKAQEREDRGTITIRTRVEDETVVCEIEDDGPGMSPDTLSCIFDPFFTTKPVGKGTGLGLSVSYDIIVNKHGGRLEAESEPGRGTCFRITLPCVSAGSAVAAGVGTDGARQTGH